MNNSGGQNGLLIDASITWWGLQKRLAVIDRALAQSYGKPGHDIVWAPGLFLQSLLVIYLFVCLFFAVLHVAL